MPARVSSSGSSADKSADASASKVDVDDKASGGHGKVESAQTVAKDGLQDAIEVTVRKRSSSESAIVDRTHSSRQLLSEDDAAARSRSRSIESPLVTRKSAASSITDSALMGRFLSRISPSASAGSYASGTPRQSLSKASFNGVDEKVELPLASDAAPSKAADEDPMASGDITHPWYFQDDFGKIQGPFTQVEMENWYDAGYFSVELMVSCEGSDVSSFYPIKDMFDDDMGEGDNPFRWDAELQDAFESSSGLGSVGSCGPEADVGGDTALFAANTMWYFRDDAGKAQGCFDSEQMRAWYEAGYFLDSLPIAAVKGGAPDPAAQA